MRQSFEADDDMIMRMMEQVDNKQKKIDEKHGISLPNVSGASVVRVTGSRSVGRIDQKQ